VYKHVLPGSFILCPVFFVRKNFKKNLKYRKNIQLFLKKKQVFSSPGGGIKLIVRRRCFFGARVFFVYEQRLCQFAQLQLIALSNNSPTHSQKRFLLKKYITFTDEDETRTVSEKNTKALIGDERTVYT